MIISFPKRSSPRKPMIALYAPFLRLIKEWFDKEMKSSPVCTIKYKRDSNVTTITITHHSNIIDYKTR